MDYGPLPELGFIDPKGLRIDQSYQRTLESRRSQNLIEKIAANFNWVKFGVLFIAKPNIIVDGQHRNAAALKVGVDKVPYAMWDLPSQALQATAFLGINFDRVNPTPQARFKAELTAGVVEAQDLDELMKAVGGRVMIHAKPHSQLKPGDTMAVSTLRNLMWRDKHLLKEVLEVLIKNQMALSACVVKVPFMLLTAKKLDIFQLDEVLAKVKAKYGPFRSSFTTASFSAALGFGNPEDQPKIKPLLGAQLPIQKQFHFDRSKPSYPASKPAPQAEVPKDFPVKKFESGTFESILRKTLVDSGYSCQGIEGKGSGRGRTYFVRVDGKEMTLRAAIEFANVLRKQAGKSPLNVTDAPGYL